MHKILAALLISATLPAFGQSNPVIASFYEKALQSNTAYENLRELCLRAPGRLVGSPNSAKALNILENQLKTLKPDTIYRQEYTTTSWRCISPSKAEVIAGKQRFPLHVVSLGLSVSTPANGLTADVVEVGSLEALDSLPQDAVKGKIVFFNKRMNPAYYRTFQAYGETVGIRGRGASKASSMGAVGAIVRSLNPEPDEFPHTGVSHFQEGIKHIPNLSVSTNDADKLSRMLKETPGLKLWMKAENEDLPTVKTANIIAEIRGSEHPEQVIVLGAHTDAWFNTDGAHDDGVGCQHMIEVFRLFKELGIKPKHTIRIVLYMDEEMNQTGSTQYAEKAAREGKKHLLAIESDESGLLPIGFSIDAGDEVVTKMQSLLAPLSEYGIFRVNKGYAGVDIEPLKEQGIPLAGLTVNSQRYFEYHHTANDTLDKVSRREMQLGAASIASFVYLFDLSAE